MCYWDPFFRASHIYTDRRLGTSLLLAVTLGRHLSLYLVRRKDNRQVTRDSAGTDMAALLAAEKPTPFPVFFGRIVIYASIRRALLLRPWVLVAKLRLVALFSVLNVPARLPPGPDDGGFILDYFTPPGSSLVSPTGFS